VLDTTKELDAQAAEAEAYVQAAFGEPLTLNPIAPARLPHFLLDRYRLWQGTLLGQPLLLAAGKYRRAGMGFTTDFVKHREVLRRELGDQPVILLLDQTTAAVRRQMIERRIGFLAPGSQLYIPEVLLDWRERGVRARPEPAERIAPTTQLVVTAALLGERLDDVNLTELAGRFDVAIMSMTRALDELETLQIAKARHIGRQRRLHFTMQGRELWDFVKDRLQSPVRKLRTIQGDLDETVAPRAGESALAHYTMLASPRIVRRAIDATRWKELAPRLTNVDEAGFDDDRIELETWRYDPVVLAKDGVVDPISLYLSVRHDKDERIEQAAEQLLEQFGWL
jgi:DNA-binding MarR family transcriptional regulator